MPDLPVLTPIEARIVGCLLEKKETTPDIYPLTLNALQAAVNQKTSRDPVMSLDAAQINHAIKQLEQKGLVRRAFASRVDRFEHRLAEQFSLLQPQAVLLALLLLRGPQTAYELMARSERMAIFGSITYLKEQLDLLTGRVPPLVVQLERNPGQREERFAHLLCDEYRKSETTASPPNVVIISSRPGRPPAPVLAVSPLAVLEQRVQSLEREMAELRAALGARSA